MGLQRYGDFYYCQEKNENFLKYFLCIENQFVVTENFLQEGKNQSGNYISKALFFGFPLKILRQIGRDKKNLLFGHLHFDHSNEDKIDQNTFCRFFIQMGYVHKIPSSAIIVYYIQAESAAGIMLNLR